MKPSNHNIITGAAVIFWGFCVWSGFAQKPKAFKDVDSDALTTETQLSAPCGSDEMNLVWVIPIEFWQVVFAQDPSITDAEADEVLNVLKGLVLVGVIQANISDLGAFDFYSEDEVKTGFRLIGVDQAGKRSPISEVAKIPDDAKILLETMRPILTAAMGNMGRNLHFIVMEDSNAGGGRAIDPYSSGKLEVHLVNRDGNPLKAEMEMPINSLFIPRKCPNGKDAHVTWKFCPWTGQKLD